MRLLEAVVEQARNPATEAGSGLVLQLTGGARVQISNVDQVVLAATLLRPWRSHAEFFRETEGVRGDRSLRPAQRLQRSSHTGIVRPDFCQCPGVWPNWRRKATTPVTDQVPVI